MVSWRCVPRADRTLAITLATISGNVDDQAVHVAALFGRRDALAEGVI